MKVLTNSKAVIIDNIHEKNITMLQIKLDID